MIRLLGMLGDLPICRACQTLAVLGYPGVVGAHQQHDGRAPRPRRRRPERHVCVRDVERPVPAEEEALVADDGDRAPVACRHVRPEHWRTGQPLASEVPDSCRDLKHLHRARTVSPGGFGCPGLCARVVLCSSSRRCDAIVASPLPTLPLLLPYCYRAAAALSPRGALHCYRCAMQSAGAGNSAGRETTPRRCAPSSDCAVNSVAPVMLAKPLLNNLCDVTVHSSIQ